MTEFREAPRKGEEGFAPLIVIATSAFGLGINRPDIRTVFCVSPPTDLAALYQQIGPRGPGRRRHGDRRGGRPGRRRGAEHAGGRPAAASEHGAGPADQPRAAHRRVHDRPGPSRPAAAPDGAKPCLSCGGVLDAARVAERLIGEDLAAGRLAPQEAGQRRTLDTYTAGVVRAFAALAGLGAVTDLGDFPPLAAVKVGELLRPPRSRRR